MSDGPSKTCKLALGNAAAQSPAAGGRQRAV